MWIMSTAMELEANGELPTAKVDQIFNELEAPMNEFYQIVNKHMEFLNHYLDKSEKRMEDGVEIIDVKDFLRRKYKK